MESKVCTKCGDEKLVQEFRLQKSNGYEYHKSICKSCELENNKIYREKNKEKEANRLKEYRVNNIDKRLEYESNYRENNKEIINTYQKLYYTENKEIIGKRQRVYEKERRINDPLFKLSGNIRRMIRKSIKSNGYTKKSKTYDILGCSYEEFKKYIESLWQPWMNWDNHGLYNGELDYGWDIDHKVPISSAITEEELLKLNHFSNLQPLCSKVNRDIKKNK
jgi:hypothetical protein